MVTTVAAPAKARTELITVTPELAASWLGKAHPNRHLTGGRVLVLANALKTGEWRVNGETIKFDEDGLMIDGQHRLQAVIDSGVAMKTYVIFGLPRDSFDTLDIGKSRTAADTLASLGYTQSLALAAAMRQMRMLDRLVATHFYGPRGGFPGTTLLAYMVTPALARKMIAQHPSLPEWVLVSRRIRKAGIIGGDGFWSGCLYWLVTNLEDAEDDVKAFTDSLIEGASLEEDDPILVLRNRLLSSSRTTKEELRQQEIAAFVFKAWNAYRSGEKMRILRWKRGGAHREDFPIPR